MEGLANAVTFGESMQTFSATRVPCCTFSRRETILPRFYNILKIVDHDTVLQSIARECQLSNILVLILHFTGNLLYRIFISPVGSRFHSRPQNSRTRIKGYLWAITYTFCCSDESHGLFAVCFFPSCQVSALGVVITIRVRGMHDLRACM